MKLLSKSRFFLFVCGVCSLCTILLFTAAFAQSGPSGSSSISGRIGAIVADYFDQNRTETTYTLVTSDNTTYTVEFARGLTPPEPGTLVTLSGRIRGETIYATRIKVTSYSAQLPPSAVGEQRFVVALVNFQDDTTTNVTVAQTVDKMFNPAYSYDKWLRENSFDKSWATGDVFGWLTLPMNRACNPTQIRTLTIQALDPLTDLTQYNRLYILIPGAAGCTWGGLGTLSSGTYTTDDGPWTTSTAWTRSEYFNETVINPRGAVFVTAHEVGHNFGQHHANSITWDAGRALGPFDCSGCEGVNTEYGDPFSSLGGSWRPGHQNAIHKMRFGWFSPGNVVEVTHSGLYSLEPYETNTNGPKALHILRGFAPTAGRYEYLTAEWRQPIGFDSEIDSLSGAGYDGIFMHWDFKDDLHSFCLDMTPGDSEMRNSPLPTGQTWNDLYTKVSIHPVGVAGGDMMVQVDIGEEVPPTSVQILRGSSFSGGLPESANSDDQYMVVRAGPTLTASEPPIWVEFTGTYFGLSPTAVRFEYEGHTNTPINQRVQLYNQKTGVWEDADSRDSTISDSFVEANVWTDGSLYVNPITGQMKARVQYYRDRPTLLWPFSVFIDQAKWKILR